MASTRHDAAEDVKPRVPHEGSRPEIAASHTRPASHPCARASEPGAKAFEEDVAAEHVDDGEQMQRQVEMARVIASLKLTRPEILRTTSAHNVLHRFGFVLRKGPYSTEYERSSQSQEIAQFWSHSWHGPVLAKIMLLYVVCNGFPAAAMGTISIAVAKTLAWHCVLPCDDRALEATLCLFIGLLVSGLTLAFWRPSRRIFLDKICINQKDVDLRTEGVLNVGAFLKCSKSMLACWDATYMQRRGFSEHPTPSRAARELALRFFSFWLVYGLVGVGLSKDATGSLIPLVNMLRECRSSACFSPCQLVI